MANQPFAAEITGIKLISHNGQSAMDLMAQMLELNFYESIFSPLVKSELIVDDKIGLFVNFPLTGEEFVVVTYKPTRQDEVDAVEYKRVFVINAITNITPSINARSYTFVIHLISRLAYENARQSISQAYPDGSGDFRVSSFAESLFNKYLAEPARRITATTPLASQYLSMARNVLEDVEPSLESQTIVIPNLHPIEALCWLAKRAVALDYTKNYTYTFYETLSGFHFKTVQRDVRDDDLKAKVKNSPYFFVTDQVIIKANQVIVGNESVHYDPRRSILNLVFNKRFSTIDKIVKGYFENQYFEINLYENSFRYKDTYLDDDLTMLEENKLNTTTYIEDTKASNGNYSPTPLASNPENRNRVKYAFNNTNGTDQYAIPFDYDKKWGRSVMSEAGFDQIDVHATVEGDTRREAGNLVYAVFPEMHGFNNVSSDKLISGYFIVSEIKHSFAPGGKHSMIMRLNKDSYGEDLDGMENKYNSSQQILK